MKLIAAAPLPIVFVVASFLAPSELSVYLAGLRLPPHRISLLLLLPVALAMFATGKVRWRGFDTLFALYNAWTLAVFTLFHSQGTEGLVFGGSLVLESAGAYFVARAFIRDERQFRATLAVLMVAVTIALMLALPEMLLGQHFTHDALQVLTGYVLPRLVETRMGLTRAYAMFDHPIHLGSFCASLLALAWYTSRTTSQRLGRAALIIVATLTAISSAPLLCLALQVIMMLWERTTRRVAGRLLITLAIIAGLYIGASLVMTRSPAALIATGFTIDSWTGYYRLLIWDYGLDNVWSNPWIGIGLAEWERPQWMAASTVDAFWLLIAMRAGIPAFVLLVAAALALAVVAGRRGCRSKDVHLRRITRGWVMSLVALSLLACTVHFWNVTHAYFFFFLGMGAWLADPKRIKAPSQIKRAIMAARAARPEPNSPGLSGWGHAAPARGSI